MSTARLHGILVALIVALVAPSSAAAHSRAPTVALDFRLRLSNSPPGVHAELIDGDRDLRLRVDRSVRVDVRGYLGEPFLRFSSTGVWVSLRSPTAAAARIRVPSGSGWIRVTRGHSFMWHDHRLSPPAHLPLGASGRWSIPIVLDGHGTAIAGTVTRVGRPSLWPWLAGALVVAAGCAVLARAVPKSRGTAAAALAQVAALAALTASAAFALGDAISRGSQWLEVACAAVLALVAAGALLYGGTAARAWVAAVIGGVAALIGLGSVSVFWHGVVISSLSPTLTRLATAVAVLAGIAAATLGVLTDEQRSVRR